MKARSRARTSSRDLRQQVGQTLIMGFDGVEGSEGLRRLLGSLQPGGVILFARNIMDARQTYALLQECRRAVEAPLFTCVDLEGGTVDRLRKVIAPAPSAQDVAATGQRRFFRKHGLLIGREARALGFNVDFAPVLDLAFPASRAVMGSRTPFDDAYQTVIYAREFLAGLAAAGVMGCGKHFPGLGEGKLDSHHELPTIEKPWKRLWEQDLYPYRALRRQLPMVMVAHAAFPSVTHDGSPASVSREWITGVLRRRIGYTGLVLCDDLDMQGVLAAGSVESAAVETLRAGADILLVCQKQANAVAAFEAVLREAERDRRFAAIVGKAAERVLRAKRKLARKRLGPAPTDAAVEQLRARMERFSEQVGTLK